MSGVIAALVGGLWKPLAAIGAVLAGALGFYLKGKSDQKAKLELKDIRDANDIRRDGAAARAGAAVSPDRLRDDDGFKRK